jgi:hypothetical protein
MMRPQIQAYELGSEKTGKPASVSIAGFFFGIPKNGAKKTRSLGAGNPSFERVEETGITIANFLA